jgi:hypothetical protein
VLLLAQGLVEYGALSGLAGAIQRAAITVEDYMHGTNAPIVLGAGAVLVYLIFFRRR